MIENSISGMFLFKTKLFKKVQAGLLTMVLIAGVLPTGLRPLTVHAATTVKTMNLDTSYLAPSDGTWDANDHKIYFGQYGGTPTAFRVLKSENGTMMLTIMTAHLYLHREKKMPYCRRHWLHLKQIII